MKAFHWKGRATAGTSQIFVQDIPREDLDLKLYLHVLVLSWDIVGLLQGSKRPLPRKLRNKSDKGLPGPLGPRVKEARKSRKKVDNEPKKKLEK